ncbi:MAG: chemotaxis protein CheD, partial [Proteobacteria bacterium]|nr:chemotaxis protein CheD [Pseudomonadota bacterium]
MTEYFVYPGQLAFSIATAKIKTILGSCVSVVLWDKDSKIGGLCHYLLPELSEGATPSARYGRFAITDLFDKIL